MFMFLEVFYLSTPFEFFLWRVQWYKTQQPEKNDAFLQKICGQVDPFLVEAGLLFSAGGGLTCCKGVISTGFFIDLVREFWLKSFESKPIQMNWVKVSMILKSNKPSGFDILSGCVFLVKSFLKFWLLLVSIEKSCGLLLFHFVRKNK